MKGKIFNAQEVQALISGNKTQFREVIKFSENKITREFQEIALKKISEGFSEYNVCLRDFFKCPYEVGQKIFCKESFSRGRIIDNQKTIGTCPDIHYWADGNPKSGAWKGRIPAQHMKQEHSRLTLLIKEIRVERLSEISEEDAIAEGFKNGFHEVENVGDFPFNAYDSFAKNWNATHKKPEEKFDANPWVWVVSCEVVK
jgi:hypothetical protein